MRSMSAPHWKLRARLTPRARRRMRSAVDRVGAGVLGSINGAQAADAVAITFDDGPDPEVTPQLIDVLDRHGANATFFLLVGQARRYPDLVRRLVAAGHEIGLHGMDHRRVSTMPYRDAIAYLRQARVELEAVCGHRVEWFRPPFGSQSVTSLAAARRAALDVVVWSCDADDWVDRDADAVAELALEGLRPGGVLLLHERLEPDPGRDAPVTSFARADAVDTIVRDVRSAGWEVLTVGAMLERYGARRTVWLRP